MYRKKGFEMPVNVVVSLVVLLVLVSVCITLAGRSAGVFNSAGEEKMDIGNSVTLCQIECFKCCRHFGRPNDVCGTSGDTFFASFGCGCDCNPSSF